jgi:hypothetical protein
MGKELEPNLALGGAHTTWANGPLYYPTPEESGPALLPSTLPCPLQAPVSFPKLT